MLNKPPACSGCSLERIGMGYAPASGPTASPILLVGEALGHFEAYKGVPFIGPSGGMLDRILRRIGKERAQVRVDNVVRCKPPKDWLDGAPWEAAAVSQCTSHHLNKTLAENPARKIIVALGGSATRHLLGLPRKKHKQGDWHGCITPTPDGSALVIPTFHPAHILRGKLSLMGTMIWDIQRAWDVVNNTWPGSDREKISLVIDPSVGEFAAWVDEFFRAYRADPEHVWLAVDTETVEKLEGADEGELGPQDDEDTESNLLDDPPDEYGEAGEEIERGEGEDSESDETLGDVLAENGLPKGNQPFATPAELARAKPTLNTSKARIVRINFSYRTDEGLTVPFAPEYMPWIVRLLTEPNLVKSFWNAPYDTEVLANAGIKVPHPIFDWMWGWHVLQSDVPRGLGYVAPFYSEIGAWKHLSGENPQEYAAFDGVQTTRVSHGIARDLVKQGQWDVFYRHIYLMDRYVLQPGSRVGLYDNPLELDKFATKLETRRDELTEAIQKFVPPELIPRDIKTEPRKELEQYVQEKVDQLVVKCTTCGAVDITKGHACPKEYREVQVGVYKSGEKSGQPKYQKIEVDRRKANLVSEVMQVVRYVRYKKFNPDSKPQLLGWLEWHNIKAGAPDKKSKTDAPSTGAKILKRLSKTAPVKLREFFLLTLRRRSIKKVYGTYVKGTRAAMDKDNRVHTVFTHKPSTLRLSSTKPNLQNVVHDKGGDSEADGFRNTVEAEPGYCLVEIDFSAMEPCICGWFMGDPIYIKVAKKGMHAYVASFVLGRPADLTWSEDDLKKYLQEIKDNQKVIYNATKRGVNGYNYGLTNRGLVNNYPEIFCLTKLQASKSGGKLVSSEYVWDMYKVAAPKLEPWQMSLRNFAHKNGYWGGSMHPFKYKHWFWAVYAWNSAKQEWGHGPDYNRVVAFPPQSTGGAIGYEAGLRMFWPEHEEADECYVGDLGGRFETPFRAMIHDSYLFSVPKEKRDKLIERAVRAMTRPITQMPLPAEWGMGEFLQLGVSVTTGDNWGKMEKVSV